MDIIESLQSTIHTLDQEEFYIEEISFKRSVDHDYWLGRYGSEKRIYLGHDWSQAMDKAQGIIRGHK